MRRTPGRCHAFRTSLLLLAVLAASGCSTFREWLPAQDEAPEPAPAPDLASLPVETAIDPNRFMLESPAQNIVGTPQVVFSRAEDTLADFALEYGIGYDELVDANPGVDPWLPGDNTPVLLPTQFVIPDVPREGIVLNIGTKRLFYFPADGIERDPETGEVTRQSVLTFPIGIGRVGWETPIGETTIVSKAKDPTWWVPASVRQEHAEMGDPLPAVVPPGPDNPLGNRVLKLDMPGYLIHGTNQPYGVGMRVSHGCVRLYPENIEFLYELVAIGEQVRIINEPYLLGQVDGEWYFESHAPLEDDTVAPEARLTAILDTASAAAGNPGLAEHLQAIAAAATGVPVRISADHATELLARARRVQNTVESDPDAPTLEEVREMIDDALAADDLEAAVLDAR